ncbi:hypothetical protein BKA56DRAFT_679366 [Ilyonectria sp. MPI-CAGE-AT-0026]|nr:hypothetical protein BKA56DRAFT_679366 [Ilyonectria sp. MPI-CAGE-AT-0026]
MSSTGRSTKEIILNTVAETLGKDALETVQPTDFPDAKPTKATLKEVPTCITQTDAPVNLRNGPVDIFVGLDKECPRWDPGSVVKWAAWRQGFKSQEDADLAALHLATATEQWNKANVGVTFEWVPLAEDATFVLCHGGAKGGVLASAFFPNANDLNYLYVYTAAFQQPYKNNMWQIFTHELGHVLGLRHEFAVDGIRDRGIAPEEFGAVQLGRRDELSVMNYRDELPELQRSDIKSTKLFYSLPSNAKVGRTPVADYTPR